MMAAVFATPSLSFTAMGHVMLRGKERKRQQRRDDITRPDLFPLSRVLAGRRGKKRGGRGGHKKDRERERRGRTETSN